MRRDILIFILSFILGALAWMFFNPYPDLEKTNVKIIYKSGCGQGLIKGLDFDGEAFAEEQEFCEKAAETFSQKWKEIGQEMRKNK